MLGTAHSNNGINIVVADVHRRCGADLSATASIQIPSTGTASRPTIFYIDNDFANAQLMQANVAVEWEFARDTSLTVTYLFVDGNDLPRSIDRNLGSLGTRTFTVAGTSDTVRLSTSSAADRRSPTSARVIAFESIGRVALQRPHLRAEPPLCGQHAVPRRLHVRQGHRHRARRHRRRPRQRRRRREIRVEPGSTSTPIARPATTTSAIAWC